MAAVDVAKDLGKLSAQIANQEKRQDRTDDVLEQISNVLVNQEAASQQIISMSKNQDRLESVQAKQWIEIDKNKEFVQRWAGAAILLATSGTLITIYLAVTKILP